MTKPTARWARGAAGPPAMATKRYLYDRHEPPSCQAHLWPSHSRRLARIQCPILNTPVRSARGLLGASCFGLLHPRGERQRPPRGGLMVAYRSPDLSPGEEVRSKRRRGYGPLSRNPREELERPTGFEPATSNLGSLSPPRRGCPSLYFSRSCHQP